ncbi:fimbrial protein [Providencia sp. TYF_10]|uniref:fimbrial protein n=1 Tax=Providencia sp. TYF_10 TaxID=3367190 RepID=UPI00370A845F
MKKTQLSSSIIALTFTAAATSFAADIGSGTIEFNGTVNTGACTIAPSSVNKEVQLGSVPAASLQTAGSQGPNIDFTLELTDCILDNETDYSKVTVKFTGQMDAAGTLWASTGTASNVGVLFQNASGENLQINDTVEQSLNAGTNVINLSARMQSLGAATAGSVKSTVAYVLDYK